MFNHKTSSHFPCRRHVSACVTALLCGALLSGCSSSPEKEDRIDPTFSPYGKWLRWSGDIVLSSHVPNEGFLVVLKSDVDKNLVPIDFLDASAPYPPLYPRTREAIYYRDTDSPFDIVLDERVGRHTAPNFAVCANGEYSEIVLSDCTTTFSEPATATNVITGIITLGLSALVAHAVEYNTPSVERRIKSAFMRPSKYNRGAMIGYWQKIQNAKLEAERINKEAEERARAAEAAEIARKERQARQQKEELERLEAAQIQKEKDEEAAKIRAAAIQEQKLFEQLRRGELAPKNCYQMSIASGLNPKEIDRVQLMLRPSNDVRSFTGKIVSGDGQFLRLEYVDVARQLTGDVLDYWFGGLSANVTPSYEDTHQEVTIKVTGKTRQFGLEKAVIGRTIVSTYGIYRINSREDREIMSIRNTPVLDALCIEVK